MAKPETKGATPAPVNPSATPKALPAFEEVVKALETNPKAVNPYDTVPAFETTASKKTRLGLGNRFETAREKAEKAEKRSIGIVGRFGRVPSVVEAFGILATTAPASASTLETVRGLLSPSGPAFEFKALRDKAEEAYVRANPDSKVATSDMSGLYSGEVSEALRLLGLLSYDAKAEAYRYTPLLSALATLSAGKGRGR